MVKDRRTISISWNGKHTRMLPRRYPPIAFLLTGFSWLVLSSILGLAILVGLVRATPLPPWVRLAHVHAALVGGVSQMILGGFLTFVPPLRRTDREQQGSHPLLLLTINAGTVGMLVGFWLHQLSVVSAAGLVVGGGFLWSAGEVWMRARRSAHMPPPDLWYYSLAAMALFAGLACGETMAFGLVLRLGNRR